MGRRSRKRPAPPPEERRAPAVSPGAAPPAPPRARTRRARLDEAPRGPWHPFPLVEVCILAGFVLLAVGVLGGDGLPIAGGLLLVGLASLELALREHFAGYRSHTTLLALAAGLTVVTVLALGARVDRPVALVAGGAVFLAAFLALRGAFRRRTGGMGFRA